MAQPAAKKTASKAPTRTRKPAKKSTPARPKSAVDKTADLSDDVLKSIEAGQRAAIEAVRKFLETVDEALPALGDRPTRREAVIDAALDMTEKLVTTQYEFLRNVVRSADRSLGKVGGGKK
ncbi:MAG: hypothetical protein MUC45_00590 [Actinomycetia bacterium]|jgi:hypothetical protein|nr:hypothetical protein [Actinomycetes bacterium]